MNLIKISLSVLVVFVGLWFLRPKEKDKSITYQTPSVDDLSLFYGNTKKSEKKVVRKLNSDNTGNNKTKKYDHYRIKQGDSLMLISFKLYGTHTRWRELASLNKALIDENNSITAGDLLRHPIAKNKIIWRPKGSPYLIKSGDTLQKVSNYAYNTVRRWFNIWQHNIRNIKDPNLIFEGQVVYYIPDSSTKKKVHRRKKKENKKDPLTLSKLNPLKSNVSELLF